MTWPAAVGLIALLTFGYVLGVVRTIAAASRSKAWSRWAVRLGNWYVKVLRWFAQFKRGPHG